MFVSLSYLIRFLIILIISYEFVKWQKKSSPVYGLLDSSAWSNDQSEYPNVTYP